MDTNTPQAYVADPTDIMDFDRLLHDHPAFSALELTWDDAYPLPAFEDPVRLPIDEGARETLANYGITLSGALGTGNFVVLERAMKPARLSINFNGHHDCGIVLEKPFSLAGQILFNGSGHLAVLCKGWYTIKVDFTGSSSGLYFGPHTSIGDGYFWIQGDAKAIVLGTDCMLAWGVGLRTGDAHGVIDIATRAISNTPRSVVVGAHVWLAQDVLVFKGTRIGSGSVVSARSVVSKDIPPLTAAAGTPAVPVKSGITWCRPAQPEDEHIDYLLSQPYLQA